ncbi:MAG TPA: helix-turn-helix transcriptional regulator [Candidatus Anammoximicrobium sp.]|nr:helix-turn-helix transcriptional regulator [Candidatus Anammoximicrobium sp.]
MAKTGKSLVDCKRVELDGVRYVIVRESVFQRLCEQAGVSSGEAGVEEPEFSSGVGLDRTSLAEKLVRRRLAAGLSQAELARRAGIRPETLNRIERGRTTPDFATVRKLVVAMNAAERQLAASATRLPKKKGD